MPLAFPTSDNDLDGFREVEFRDGPKKIPDYVADLMADYDTIRYTHEEALGLVNNALAARHVDNAFQQALKAHFRGNR